jgi:hypothetical protein
MAKPKEGSANGAHGMLTKATRGSPGGPVGLANAMI